VGSNGAALAAGGVPLLPPAGPWPAPPAGGAPGYAPCWAGHCAGAGTHKEMRCVLQQFGAIPQELTNSVTQRTQVHAAVHPSTSTAEGRTQGAPSTPLHITPETPCSLQQIPTRGRATACLVFQQEHSPWQRRGKGTGPGQTLPAVGVPISCCCSVRRSSVGSSIAICSCIGICVCCGVIRSISPCCRRCPIVTRRYCDWSWDCGQLCWYPPHPHPHPPSLRGVIETSKEEMNLV